MGQGFSDRELKLIFFSPQKIALATVWTMNHKEERTLAAGPQVVRPGTAAAQTQLGYCGEQGRVPSALPFSHNILFLGDFHIINFILSIITVLKFLGDKNHTDLIYLSNPSLL